MHKSYVWSNIGRLLIIIGCSMMLPAAAGIYFGEAEYLAFVKTAMGTLLAGLFCYLIERPVGAKRMSRCVKAFRLWHMDGSLSRCFLWCHIC